MFHKLSIFKRVFRPAVRKCSTIGPSASAGQEVQRADQQHRAEQQDDERAAGTGKRARAGRRDFFCTSEPASAMIGTIIRKRPINMARPRVVLYQGVLAVRPAKALPLLPVPELKA